MAVVGSETSKRTLGTLPSDGGASGSLPQISLPKGGGAIRDIGEKFSANPVTGAGTSTVPMYVSPGRSGFAPQLDLFV